MIRDEQRETETMTSLRQLSARRAKPGRSTARGLLLGVALLAFLALGADRARAQFGDGFGIEPGSLFAGTCDLPDNGMASTIDDWHCGPSSPPVTEAGAHPDATASFELNPVESEPGGPHYPDGNVKEAVAEIPPGLVGNPEATPKCPLALAVRGNCPVETQVGVITLRLSVINPDGTTNQACSVNTQPSPASFPWFGQVDPPDGPICRFPLWSIEPPGGETAAFAFRYFSGLAVQLTASVRSDEDFGLRVRAQQINEFPAVSLSSITLWGVPGDPKHDPFRFRLQSDQPQIDPGAPWPADVPVKPFLTNPTWCDGSSPVTTLNVRSWQDPDVVKSDSFSSPPVTGCEDVPFDPDITLQPTSQAADSPTGLDVELEIPQQGWEDPGVLGTSHLKDTVVTLPEGMAVSPSAANGLQACTPEQIGLRGTGFPAPTPIRFDDDPVSCPAGSTIGRLQIDTPVLEEPVEGRIYLAAQDDNPFNSLLAVYLVLESEERNLRIKIPGKVDPDPRTGQLEATFLNNPQLPFERFELHFKGGDRGVLVNPPTCGVKTTTTQLAPWARPDEPVTVNDTFQITSGPNGMPCASTLGQRPFDLGFSAGLVDPVAGSSSPFVLRLTRPDGHQEIDSLEVRTPPGLAAVLKGIPTCSDAGASSGNCPEASRIGTSIAGAGPGPSPYYVREGKVFLAGPYKGAPLSLAIQVPAVAGPFDLGIVNVRAAVHVDPRTAQLTVKSDPIPRILEGIPLRVRDIRIRIDRPGFMVSPTNCDPMRVEATVHGSHGASSPVSDRFQLGGCGQLGFDPKLRFQIKGKGATKRSEHPALEATLTPNEGEANIERVRVALPKGMLLDQANIANICTRPQFAAGECPENSIFGSAVAHTPLLEGPVQGNVYLRASDNPLPDLVADLKGSDHPIEIDLVGAIDSPNNRIRNDFAVVPDVPVSDFELRIDGGPEGLLVNSRDLCSKKKLRKTNVGIWAHNAKTAHQKPKLKAKACKKGKAKRLERKAKRLKRKARREAKRGNEAKAKRLRNKAKRVERQANRIERATESGVR